MSYKGKEPWRYDKNSRSWKEGANKNWPYPGGVANNPSSAKIDRDFLENARRER